MQVVVQVVVEVLVPDRHGGQVLHAEVLSGVGVWVGMMAQHPLGHPGPLRSFSRPPFPFCGVLLFAEDFLCSSDAYSCARGQSSAATNWAWAFGRRQSRRREVRGRRGVGVVAVFVGVEAGIAWQRRWGG